MPREDVHAHQCPQAMVSGLPHKLLERQSSVARNRHELRTPDAGVRYPRKERRSHANAAWNILEGQPKKSHSRFNSNPVGRDPIETVFSMLSLLLIVAFLCANLPVKIQAFPSYCKYYFASSGNNRQENLCGLVRLCGKCAAAISSLILCGNCAGVFAPPASD